MEKIEPSNEAIGLEFEYMIVENMDPAFMGATSGEILGDQSTDGGSATGLTGKVAPIYNEVPFGVESAKELANLEASPHNAWATMSSRATLQKNSNAMDSATVLDDH